MIIVSIKICESVNIVPSTPELPVSVFEFHASPFLVDHQTALTFQKSHETRYAYLRRDC